MSADVPGNAIATLAGLAFVVASIAQFARRKWRLGRYFALTAYMLIWPVKLWFWQFELTGRGLPRWYVGSAVEQILFGIGILIYVCLYRFRPVLTALALVYVFSLLLQLFSYMYWAYGTAGNFNITLSHLDAFYFTLGTLTTAGTGNISSISETARGIQTLQMGLGWGLIAFVVVLILTRYSNLLDRPQKLSMQDNAMTATAIVERLVEIERLLEAAETSATATSNAAGAGDAATRPSPPNRRITGTGWPES
jgi:Ion channel